MTPRTEAPPILPAARDRSIGLGSRMLFVLVVAYLVLNRAIPDIYTLPIGVSLRLDEVVLVMVLAGWAVARILEPNPLPSGAVGFLGLSILAVLTWSPYLQALDLTQFQSNGAERGLFRLFIFAGLFLAGHHLAQDLGWGRKLVAVIIGLSGVQALLAVWEFVQAKPLTFFASLATGMGLEVDPRGIRGEVVQLAERLTGETRAATTAPHPIVLSAVVATAGLIAAVWYLHAEQKRERRWAALGLAACLIGLPAANSRTGFVIVAALVFPLVVLLSRQLPRAIPASLLAMGLAAISFAISPRTPRLLLNSFLSPGEDPNTTIRLERFSLLPELLSPRPAFGAGFLTHDPALQLFDNGYNLGLIEFGIVGLAIVLMFVLAVMNRCRHALEKASPAEATPIVGGIIAGLALLVGSATFDAFAFDQFLPTIILLMGVGLGRSAVVLERHGVGVGLVNPMMPGRRSGGKRGLRPGGFRATVARQSRSERRAHVAMVAYTHYVSDPRVRRSAEALAAAGHRVEVLSLDWGESERRRDVDGVTVRGIWRRRYRGSSLVSYLLGYVGFLVSASVSLTRIHSKDRVDVIHVHNMPDFMVFAALPLKLRGVRVILDIHDLMPELYASKFGASLNHPIPKLIRWVEKRSIAFAHHTFVTHDLALETLVQRGNPADRISVLHNLPDPGRFPPGAALDKARRPGPLRLIYHGTLAPRHGLDVAIRAVAKVEEAMPVEMLIIGDGDDVPRLESLIEELDLGSRVELRKGFVPVDELLPVLVDADVGIVPIHRDIGTDHMLPTKLLEYVQLGIPTICSELATTLRYFTDDQVGLVPSGDIDAIVDQIRSLDEEGERRSMARRATRFFDRADWTTERTHLEDTIVRLAAGRGSVPATNAD